MQPDTVRLHGHDAGRCVQPDGCRDGTPRAASSAARPADPLLSGQGPGVGPHVQK